MKNIKSLSECVAAIEKRYEEDKARAVKRAESVRQALMLLSGAGVDVEVSRWWEGTYLEIDLGEMPPARHRRKREEFTRKLTAIRQALGCPLKLTNKSPLQSEPLLNVTLRPADFPDVEVYYKERLPKGAKCKLVKRRVTRTELVCQA